MVHTEVNLYLQESFPFLRYLNERFCVGCSLSAEAVEYLTELYLKDSSSRIQEEGRISLSELVIYLECSHRNYLQKKFPELEQTLNALFLYHEDFALNLMVKKLRELIHHLEKHILQEEQNTIPYIIYLLDLKAGRVPESFMYMNRVRLRENIKEHDFIEDQLAELSSEISALQLKNSSIAFNLLVSQLDFLVRDIRLHGRIEDELVMPAALVLENELKREYLFNKNYSTPKTQ